MKYANPQLRQMLAAEYALGTLRGAARRRFEALLAADEGLRSELVFWETRLAQLGLDLAPVTPSQQVWAAIEQRIGKRARPRPSPQADQPQPWWRSLNLWRGAFAVSTLAAVVLAVLLWVSPGAPPAQVAEQQAPAPEFVSVIMNKRQQPAWLFTVDSRSRFMSLKVMPGHPQVPQDKDMQLWMLPAQNQPPVALALIPQAGSVTRKMPPKMMAALKSAQGLAVSLEPKGGSPTGKPTGPVLFTAQLMTSL